MKRLYKNGEIIQFTPLNWIVTLTTDDLCELKLSATNHVGEQILNKKWIKPVKGKIKL